jgi:hypothetical protein
MHALLPILLAVVVGCLAGLQCATASGPRA